MPEEISEHARYVHFLAVLPLCATLSELVACCGREMHSLLEPLEKRMVVKNRTNQSYFGRIWQNECSCTNGRWSSVAPALVSYNLWGTGQSIGSTDSNAILRNWSCPFGYFTSITESR